LNIIYKNHFKINLLEEFMIKSVIMAGGFGTRLRPLTMTLPKPMVKIKNIPMMEHIVNLLKKHNIKDIVSVLYYHPDIITNYFDNGSAFGINMDYVLAQADYGTAGAVKNAQKFLDKRFIIISGDVLTDFDLTKAIEYHESKKSMATILLTRVPAPLQYGIVMTNEDGKISRFLEKPSWGQVFSDTINTGIYILEPEVLDLIPYQEEFDFSKDLFPLMLRKNLPLYGYITDGYWRDIGNLNEYQLGQSDALKGDVQLYNGDKSDDENIISQSAKLASTVILKGNNSIGDNVKIGNNVELFNCVIGNNVKINDGTRLLGATIWDNVKIGNFAEIYDSVICNDTVIGDNVTIFENVFVAEKCVIENGAELNPNIKLWPNKRVEQGAILSRSLVQEEKWLRELFTDARISGLSNIDMNPEFGAKLGAAFGLTLQKKSTILSSRDSDPVSRIIKRSITAGLTSVGINVNDLQEISIPQTRQELNTKKYSGGLHVRRSPRKPDYVDIIIFSKDGRDISISTTKKIERFFFGEEIKRVHHSKVGSINYPERTNEIYVSRFIESLNFDIIQKRKFKLLMDYSFGLASNIMPNILGKLNADVLSLNNYVDSSKFYPSPSDNKSNDETGKIMSSLGYELGFRMQPGAEQISVIDESGKWYSQTRMLSIVTKLFLETNKNREPYKIAVSIVAPKEIEMVAKDYNVEVVRIKNSHSAMMDATLDENVLFAGGVFGGYIFPEFLFAADGMYSVGKILEMLAITDKKISTIDSEIPRRSLVSLEVHVPWESKGTVMRKAMEHTENKERQLVEGIKFFEDNNSVLLLPAKEKASFLIYAESDSYEDAQKLSEKYSELITDWKS
jgi:mannose-1-phosphate guanylyltransferase/phosphomannomutase